MFAGRGREILPFILPEKYTKPAQNVKNTPSIKNNVFIIWYIERKILILRYNNQLITNI